MIRPSLHFTLPPRRGVIALLAAIALASPAVAQPDQKVQDAILADALASRTGYDFLGRLCDDFGGRLTGSPQNEAALERTVAELKTLGVDARLERFKMPGWVRGDDEITLLTPIERPLRVSAFSYTQPHPAFEGEVVDIKQGSPADFAAVTTAGKIGLLAANTTIPRGQWEVEAKKHGLRALLFINREGGGQLLARTGSFQGEPVPLPVLCVTQEEGLWMSRLLARGEPVRVRIALRSHGEEIDTANIVVRFPGRTADKIVVGGHFDSWDFGQGATDNGLGVAQLFELARLLRRYAQENERTVELVWFNGEEQGLWGSRHQAPLTRGKPVAAMINLDMVGYPISVNALGSDALVPVLERYAASMPKARLKDGVINVNWFASDHTPYQLEGIPTITYGAHIDRDVVRYYHDLGDTFDKITPEIIAESSATIAALVYRLANETDLPTTRATPEEIAAGFKKYQMEDKLRGVGLWPFDSQPEAKP